MSLGSFRTAKWTVIHDPSLSELAAHEALRVPPHTLWDALAVHGQLRLPS
jgi:hypothetical protein